MFASVAFMNSITPDLWRETLRGQGITLEAVAAVKEDTTEILALVRELRVVKGTTVHEDTLIAMARKIRPRVADRDEALRELERAAPNIAAEQMERGHSGSNVDAFVDDVLRRLADLTEAGELDAAASAADDAVDQAEAGLTQLIGAAINQHLLAYDAQGAARQITRRLTLETPDPANLLDALRREQDIWYERGRDRGLRLDLEVAIALARTSHGRSHDADQRGMALIDLGTALATLGARETGTARLEEAVAAYRGALEEWTRDRVPLGWAATQNNLGTALQTLGARETGTNRLEEAVAAYRDALKERTRDRVPLDWATTKDNFGNTLKLLGERETGTARLVEAVDAYCEALKERTRDRVPLKWAATQMNLGNALQALGVRETGTPRLDEAVAAYREALKENTREHMPLQWAMTQNNLGVALASLGKRKTGTARLDEAVDAYREALKEHTRDRVPLNWAMTSMNLGNALQALGTREIGTARLDEAVDAYRNALKERTCDRVPFDWAMTQANLAIALAEIARRTGGDFSQALAAIDGALARTIHQERHSGWHR